MSTTHKRQRNQERKAQRQQAKQRKAKVYKHQVLAARRAPRPLDVWTLLPQSNCKCCGEATCMAFARFPAEIEGCCSKSGRWKSVPSLPVILRLRIAMQVDGDGVKQ